MKDSRLTKAEAVELAYKAMDKYHDENYVYEYPDADDVCKYKDREGNPSCLVGCILHDMGVALRDWWDAMEATAEEVLTELQAESVIGIEPDAYDFLVRLQDEQDSRQTWGEAIRTAAR